VARWDRSLVGDERPDIARARRARKLFGGALRAGRGIVRPRRACNAMEHHVARLQVDHDKPPRAFAEEIRPD